jgi:predicted AAA+ superfamily ATPase
MVMMSPFFIFNIQVCYNLNDPTAKDREINGLIKATKFIGNKKGIILSLDEEFTIKENGVKIRALSARKWCYDLTDLYLL